MKYEFDDKRHRHTLDGKSLFGITTVLSVISKPALIPWAAKMAVEHIWDNLIAADQEEDWLTVSITELENAKSAHRRKKEGAGDIGTAVHEWIEQYVIARIAKTISPSLPEDKQVAKMVKNFIDWAVEEKVEFLESEKHLYSEKMWTGGIVDMVFMMDGKKYIGDIKTGSGIYDEAFFQMAGYHLMLEEMGGYDDIEGYIVINLQKNGKMDLKMAQDLELNKEAFRSALSLYRIIRSLK